MAFQINHFSRAEPGVEAFDRTYQEVLSLLDRARDYAVSRVANPERASLESSHKLIATCEAMRVTSRLTQCLAWLLVQRAIHSGELPPEAAGEPENRLGGEAVCAEGGHEEDGEMPFELRGLLKDSRLIYERLSRLDDRVATELVERRDAAAGSIDGSHETGSPEAGAAEPEPENKNGDP